MCDSRVDHHLSTMMRLLHIIVFVIAAVSISAQIVNIEKKRLDADTTGWHGDIFANMAIQRTTKNLLNVNTGGHLSYDFGESELLLIGELGFVKGEGERFSNNGFLHLRHTTSVSKLIYWESFTQVQYNALTKIDNRWLTGTGPRFQLTEYDNALFYWGVLYMYEREAVSDQDVLHNDHRMSTYFSFNLAPQETISFNSTTYVQPRIDRWSDYRLLTDNTLSLGITDKLGLRISLRMTYDRVPPPEVPTLTYNMHNGLTYKFR